MKKILAFGVLINLVACNQNKPTESPKAETNNNREVIVTLLTKMYASDLENHDILNDTLIFSKEIVELNEKCDSITKVDSERIAKSISPTDKPILREGSEVSSLYEGVTDFKINDIKTNGEKIEVFVILSNKMYKDKKTWSEKIIFINKKGLKIDNIYFDNNLYHSNSNEPNLKENLESFSKQIIK